MKINIDMNHEVTETEISIVCNHMTREVERIIAMLRIMDLELTGVKGDETYLINVENVFYIETVDKKAFIYTAEDVFESTLKLYQFEELLSGVKFFRTGKSSIVNFKKVKSLKSEYDGRMLITLNNDEKIYASRQYAVMIKKKLGVKR